jgi:hypothetical protein
MKTLLIFISLLAVILTSCSDNPVNPPTVDNPFEKSFSNEITKITAKTSCDGKYIYLDLKIQNNSNDTVSFAIYDAGGFFIAVVVNIKDDDYIDYFTYDSNETKSQFGCIDIPPGASVQSKFDLIQVPPFTEDASGFLDLYIGLKSRSEPDKLYQATFIIPWEYKHL